MADPILCEIVQNAFEMVAQEAGIRAARSAGSAFVTESDNVACSLFDRHGRMIAKSSGGLSHVEALRWMLKEVLAQFPEAALREGDTILSNSQFNGGIHPTDVGAFRPIFHEGRVAYWSAVMMLVGDLGGTCAGSLPANGTEIFHEGLILPPTKLYEGGVLNEGVMRIILGNSRTPGKLRTDIEALAGAGNVASLRIGELVGKYGAPLLTEIVEQMFDYSERMTRAGVSAIPDGVYHASYFGDDDGIEPEKNFEVKVKITVAGSEITFDFTGSAPQAKGPTNSSYSQSVCFTVFTLRCYLPSDITANEGFFRPIKIILPEGTVVNPRYPAACNIRFNTGLAIVDAINNALRPLFPDRSVASSGSTCSFNVQGRNPETGGMWSTIDVIFGVGGARARSDAVDGLPFVMFSGAGYARNIEAYEIQYPLVYDFYRFEPDTGGPGTYRGSASLAKRVTFLEDGQLTTRGTGRFRLPPAGVEGGLPGAPGRYVLNEGTDCELRLPTMKTNHPLRAGDVLTGYCAAGGGYGDPRKREPQRVLDDVRAGVVTREAARVTYGVVVNPEATEVDIQATRLLRAN